MLRLFHVDLYISISPAHDRAFKLSFKSKLYLFYMSIVTLIKKRTYISKVSENHFSEADLGTGSDQLNFINLANVFKSKSYTMFTPFS